MARTSMLKAAAALLVAGMVGLGAAGAAGAAETEYNWRIAVTTPDGHPYNVGLERFKERVETGSGGRISVAIFPSGQLGGEVESAKNLQLGTLDMTVISTSNTSPLYEPLEIFGVPYLFKSLSCAYKVLDGPIGQQMADGLRESAGLRVLGWYTFGMRQIINTKHPILKPADLKGMVFRVPADKMAEAAYRAMGANPVPMAFTEMFNALQQGVIDGADNPLITVQNFKWYEVVRYISLTSTAAGLSPFLMSEKEFSALPPDLQELVVEAGKESAVANREKEAELTAAARGQLEQEGVRIDVVDTAPFRAAVEPVFEMAREKFGADTLKAIEDAQSGC
jgi:tripartite ATP-independent transporter DctP family solute receptor